MENNEILSAFVAKNPYISSLHQEADNIQSVMDVPANLLDPASLTSRLRDLDVYMARLSDMMIRAKAMKDRAKNDFIIANEERINKMTATVANRLIDTELFEYNTLYTRLDTMYHTIEHLTRDLVTQISYIKKQFESFGG